MEELKCSGKSAYALHLPPLIMTLYLFYSYSPSCLGFPRCTHHVYMFVDGVRRPSKSKSTCLIPCSHNHYLITIPFTPAAPQGFFPSSTIYTHVPLTILGQWQYYILPAHY